MAETTARNIADYIISFSHEHGDPVSNLKLQKLLYYSQAWYLALYDKPLFDERLEAWVHGPAVPPVYGMFKGWAWTPIGEVPPLDHCREQVGQHVAEHLDEVMDVYGGMAAYDLEKLAHSEMPWQKARQGLSPDESSNALISHEDMKAFYRSRLNGN